MLLILIKITVGWGVFALLFSAMLRYETFFKINRIYLIFSVLAGLGLPFFLNFLEKGNAVATANLVLPQITVGVQQIQNLENSGEFLGVWPVVWGLYFLGFSVAATRFFWGLRQIFLLAKNAKRERDGGFQILKTGKTHLPFSFFNLIFFGKMGEGLTENGPDFQKILAHEKAHVRGGHSFDVVFLEILCVVFWFHPLVFWYKNALRNVHEYLADASATARFSDKKQYGLLLIRQTQSGPALALANHFFPSQLKKRIVMLTKNASPARSGWKFSLVLPLLAGLVFVFQNTDLLAQTADPERVKRIREIEAAGWVLRDTVTTFHPTTHEESVKFVENDLRPYQNERGETVFLATDILPEFPGGQDAVLKFLMGNTKYPATAKNAKKAGMVVVKFVVDKTGKVVDVQKSELQEDDLDASLEAEAIRVVSSMPDWKPAVQKGQPVNTEMCIPIKFKLD